MKASISLWLMLEEVHTIPILSKLAYQYRLV